jgi:hypothetical protein
VTLADRFLDRYSPCSTKSYGEYREGKPEPAKTVKHTPDTEAVARHLKGEVGLGLVPLDGEVSRWGAIDIDNHQGEKPPDLKELAIRFERFPGIVVTRSKSGGAHVYFFLKEPVSGRQIRSTIHQVAMATGLEGNEVFPKQNKIRADGWGNWINLPYFGGNKSNRYGVKTSGEHMTVKEFLDQPRTTPAEIESIVESLNVGAPPCIQRLLQEPPAQGHRNMALFSLAVFFKRSSPGSWQEKTTDYAINRMEPPLPQREIRTVIRSVNRKEYTYRCTEAPLVDLCDKDGCRLARHGLTVEEHQQQGDPVGVVSLTKYLTEPPVWDLLTELGTVRLSTKALLSHSLVREAIAETRNLPQDHTKAKSRRVARHSIRSDGTMCGLRRAQRLDIDRLNLERARRVYPGGAERRRDRQQPRTRRD